MACRLANITRSTVCGADTQISNYSLRARVLDRSARIQRDKRTHTNLHNKLFYPARSSIAKCAFTRRH